MKHFEIIFKSGTSIIVTAEECTCWRSNADGSLIKYKFDGIEENRPLYLNFNEIAGIFQLEVQTSN